MIGGYNFQIRVAVDSDPSVLFISLGAADEVFLSIE